MSSTGLSEQRPTRVEVDLDALAANLSAIQHLTGGVPLLGVVKADAYGHGAIPMARTLVNAGIDWLGVALLEEALELRQADIRTPILMMGALTPAQAEPVVQNEITPAVFREDQLAALDQAASLHGKLQPVHLKVDTGMGRLGVRWTDLDPLLTALKKYPRLTLDGAFSHLACADEPGHPLTQNQMDRFHHVIDRIRAAGFYPRWCHLANSAAILDQPPTWLTLVRPGLLLYGYSPCPGFAAPPLAPVLKLSTRVVCLKELPVGEAVGYGATFVAQRPSRIAVIAAGYEDGVVRSLSNRGHGLVRGQRVPIRGRVSMDLTTLDVTDVSGVAVGDEVVLIGAQGSSLLGADEVASAAGTITWEILCGISWRVPRLYLQQGRIVETRSRFANGEECP